KILPGLDFHYPNIYISIIEEKLQAFRRNFSDSPKILPKGCEEMHFAGIVAEYNPFHNGHVYQVEQTRKAGATHIVAVMSGNVVQRGEVACFSKWTRAEAAVRGGVDLVVELPAIYV